MISRVGNVTPTPPPDDSSHMRAVATAFEKVLTAYHAALSNLNAQNLDAQLSNIANRTVELLEKAQEAQTC